MTEPKTKLQRDEKGRLLPGSNSALIHGISFYTRTGKVPLIRGRRRILADINRTRKAIEDYDQDPSNPLRQILIGQIVQIQGYLGLAFEHCQRAGVFRADRWRRGIVELQPVLHSITGWLNTQRLACLALGGLDQKKASEILDVTEYVRRFDEAKVKEGKAEDGAKAGKRAQDAQGSRVEQGGDGGDGQDKGSGAGEIEAPESTSSDIPGPEDAGTRDPQARSEG